MKSYDDLTDDQGRKWEILRESRINYFGDTLYDEDGNALPSQTIISFKFRLDKGDNSGEWLTLPPWADVRDEWKINLCWFDEIDEDANDLIFWPLAVAEEEVPAA